MKRSILLLIVLAACRPPAAEHSAQHITGTAALVAPIVGANIRITRLDSNPGELIGTAVTDDTGAFDIELADTEGAVLVELLGTSEGKTLDPVSRRDLSLSLTDRFAAVITKLKLGESRNGVVISPWSTLIAARVQWDVAYNHRSFDEALEGTMALFVQHFGDRAFLDSSAPLDPTAGPTNGLSTNALHGFITTALAAMGIDLSRRLQLTPSGLVTTISMTQWLADDLRADGAFNGVGTKGVINILDEQNLDPEATRALLGAALGSFMTSAENKSGVGLSDMTAIITAISTDTSALYGTATPAGATSIGPGPKITLASPLSGSAYREATAIIGTAESTVGVAGVELALDGQSIGNGGERSSTTKIIWALNANLDDGFHTLRIDAKDAAGQASSLTVTFNSDKTPPIFLFGSCKAPDDTTRLVLSDFVSGHVDWGSPAFDATCTATALTPKSDDDAIILHQFAELSKARATSASLNLVPEDHGPVFSEPHEIAMRAGIYRKGKLVGIEATIPASGVSSSIREIAISSDLFGDALLDVSSNDVLELRITVVDRLGNESTSSFKFKLDLLPTPFAAYDYSATVPGSQRITSYSFASNNAQQVFDASINRQFGLYIAGKYAVRNVSDRPATLKLTGSPADVVATITEWRGLVAGENTSWGLPNGLAYSSMTTCAQTQGQLTNPVPPPIYDSCFNSASDTIPSQGSLPANPWVLMQRGGQSLCIRADEFPEDDPTVQLDPVHVPWRIIVTDAVSGVPLVQSASSEYTLAANATANVFVGFDVPVFAQRSLQVCSPSYVGTPNVLSSAIDPHRAAITTLTGILPDRMVYNGDFTWQGPGYIDCSGMTCTGSDCRSTENQVVLRAQGTVFYEDIFIGSGSCYWLRRAYRRAANINLARMRTTSSFAVKGNFALSTTARLPRNPIDHPNAFDLPVESFAVDHSSRATNQPPDHPVRYTKGLLP
ncbi:MAG: hypothetical protein IT381_33120 [Deltaproteobacteria bacterium]|nr:hypothetical protein [Deltaproteobacteria bacterium]